MYETMPGHAGVMGLGGFFGLLFWIVLIVIAVMLLRWLLTRETNQPEEWSAMDILNKRFAAGDLTEEEYLKMKKRLEENE